MSYKKRVVEGLTAKLLGFGYRVFVAESGEYGFFTDTQGARIVSFGFDYSALVFSGNYKSLNCGSGWRIGDRMDLCDIDEGVARLAINASPPEWCTRGELVRMRTLESHLAIFQKSSRYVERLA